MIDRTDASGGRHIVFVYGELGNCGGTERVLSVVANDLVSDGFQVSVIACSGSKPFFHFDDSIRIYTLNRNLVKYVWLILSVLKIAILLRKLRPDVVINVGTELSLVDALVMPRRSKFITWEHFTFQRYTRSWKMRFGQWLAKRRSDRIVLLTKRDADDWNSQKVKVISNPNSFRSPQVTPLSRQNTTIEKRVISAGRLVDEKGFALLVRAARIVTERHPQVRFDIYGKGQLRDALLDDIEKMKLSEHVFIQDPCKNIQDKMSEANLYVSSALYEPFGLVITEAMSCGLPVVAFDCPWGPSEIIADGEDGFLVKNGSVEELAQKINCLLDDESVCAQMGENASINVRRFDLEVIIGQWKELIMEN